jgi:hypothetical protein
VLLLVVLSMLTLFLMLGAAYIVTATRARETARAYAKLTFGGDEARIPYARLLDGVLLDVLAGGTNAVRTGGSPSLPLAAEFESLLADKYGLQTLSGTATSLSLLGPVITASVTLPSVRPTDLVGRVLTLVEPGRPATSHRIVRATGSGATNAATTALTLYLDVPIRTAPFTLAGGAARVIINGREFAGVAPANEGWDGYDAANNQFLAQVRTSTTSISQSVVLRGSYVQTVTAGSNAGTFVSESVRYSFPPVAGATLLSTATDFNGDLIPDAADNDNDGFADGVFLDFGIPDTTDAYGNTVQIRASVLVLPLDGRFNVNAHDSLASIIYSSTHTAWPTAPLVSGSFARVPMGSGYGPVDIRANLGSRNEATSGTNASAEYPRLFDTAALQTGSNENPRASVMAGNRTLPGRRSAGSRYTASGTTPQLGNLEGRYGEEGATALSSNMANSLALDASDFRFSRPGRPRIDDPASRTSDRRARPEQADDVNYGIPNRWWSGDDSFNWGQASSSTPLPRGVFNSPPDLHGRMKTLTLSALVTTSTGIVPAVAFAQPEWSSSVTPRETKDDPYELRLDTRRGFGGLLSDPSTAGSGTNAFSIARDNPFTPAELEPVLRPYDIDTNRLPPRLAAMLGSAGEESRLKITTDSWDTTAITGSAAITIFGPSGWLQGISGALSGTGARACLGGAIGGEVSRGEKFDLNRALAASGTANAGYAANSDYVIQRQAYFKDLYTLLLALSPLTSGSTLAQWAANVVEFRDADSRVIPFEYDTAPQNGWQDDDGNVTTAGTDRKLVWGAERPEIVIREAFAWQNSLTGSAGMVVALHRPWNARAYASGSTDFIDAEPCDYALDTIAGGKPTNQVDLGKKANPAVLTPGTFTASVYNDVAGTTYPIWRLRLVAGGSTSYVRFDSGSASAGEFVISPPIANGNDKPKMAVDSTLTLASGTVILTGTGPTSGTARLTVTGSLRTVAGMRVSSSGTVYLERLADPSSAPAVADWSANPTVGADTATSAVRYLVVDETPLEPVNVSGVSAQARSWVRSTSSATQAFWKLPDPQVIGTIEDNAVLPFPTPLDSGSSNKTAWLPWPNRPFVSSAELLLVPRWDSSGMLRNYQRPTTANQNVGGIPIPQDLLFDAVHVPTRFAGIHTTATNTQPALTGIDTTITTVNQFSSFREPGRVNLNVVPSDDVWNAVVAGPLAGPVVTGTRARLSLTGTGDWSPDPATSLLGMLALSGTGATIVSDTTTTVSGTVSPMPTNVLAWDKNPLHEIYTATRLANTTTPRSNVFGVWITLRESVPNDPDSVKLRRAFYIVDRSIPVGFDPGRTLNAWDCVRLRRIIE